MVLTIYIYVWQLIHIYIYLVTICGPDCYTRIVARETVFLWNISNCSPESPPLCFAHQECILLQETDVGVINVHVDLIQEGHLPVASGSSVLAAHGEGHQLRGQVVILTQDVGVRTLIVVVEVVKCPVVWITRNGALIKLCGGCGGGVNK